MSGSGLFAIFFVVVLGLIVLGMVQSVLRQQQIGELRRSGTRVAATVTNILHERGAGERGHCAESDDRRARDCADVSRRLVRGG